MLVDKLERLLSSKKINGANISAVGGPCLAAGLANRVNTSVVIANKDILIAKKIADMLNTNYYHTSHSDDLNGVEVSAAIKNIFSMAVGAAKGLCSNNVSDLVREKNYLNTASALIKQSIYEMEVFVEHLKGKKETVKGLAGLGDLYVSSGGGRNAKMGSYIGEGMTFSEAKKNKMEKVTVEGADLAKEIAKKVNEDFDKKKIPIYCNTSTKKKLKSAYSWIFKSSKLYPQIMFFKNSKNNINIRKKNTILKIKAFNVIHGKVKTRGYLFNKIAYI